MKFSPRRDTGYQTPEAYSSDCAFADLTSIMSWPAIQDEFFTPQDQHSSWEVPATIEHTSADGQYHHHQGRVMSSPESSVYSVNQSPPPNVEYPQTQVDMNDFIIPSPTTVLDSLPPIQPPSDQHVLQRQSTQAKPKRKRVINGAQRKAANIRERRRMFNINEAFDELRKKVPTFAYEKGLSRIETLKLAIVYISFLKEVLEGKNVDEVKLPNLRSFSQSLANFSANSKSNSSAAYDGLAIVSKDIHAQSLSW